MACFQPLIGIDEGWKADGKRNIKVLPHNAMAACGLRTDVKYIQIPCGHCIGCRSAQAKEWSNRLLMESLYHEKNFFITLSYSDTYAVRVPSQDLDTGEYLDRQTLYKQDIQNFFKRLRKKFKNSKFRYYCVGEYGPVSQKPHYHILLFCDFAVGDGFDMIPSGRSETGNTRFDSKILDSLWIQTEKRRLDLKQPMSANEEAVKKGKSPNLLGWTDIEPANYYTMRYVAGYVTKKLGQYPNDMYLAENRIPPFAVSSRRPGIGYQFLIDHPEVMEDDKIYIGQPQGVVEFMPPKYFRKKCAEYDPGLMDEISEKHVLQSDARFRATLSQTDLDEENYNKLLNDVRVRKNALRNKL